MRNYTLELRIPLILLVLPQQKYKIVHLNSFIKSRVRVESFEELDALSEVIDQSNALGSLSSSSSENQETLMDHLLLPPREVSTPVP
jgi:hypothetical protein